MTTVVLGDLLDCLSSLVCALPEPVDRCHNLSPVACVLLLDVYQCVEMFGANGGVS